MEPNRPGLKRRSLYGSVSGLARPNRDWAGLAVGAAITGLVAGPWLAPGYLFGTDWPGPRHFDFPTTVTSATPVQELLAVAAIVLTGELAGKLLILASIFAAAVFAYLAVPLAGLVPKSAAATLYVFNPFVFDRVEYGQVYLLASYAALPLIALSTRRLLTGPRPFTSVGIGIGLAVIAAFTVHVFFLGSVVVIALFAAFALFDKNEAYARKRLAGLAAAGATTLVLTAYWTVPLLAGRGRIVDVLSAIGRADIAAFASVPDTRLGLVPNIVGLYGFWGEATGRFASMKEYVPGWPVVLAVILVTELVGLSWAWRRGGSVRAWAVALAVVGFVSVAVEALLSSPLTLSGAEWLAAHVAVLRGMRDAGKWSVLVSLAHTQLFAIGVAALLERLTLPDFRHREWAVGVVGAVALAMPIYYGNGLLYGAHGTVTTSQYPSGWYAADNLMRGAAHDGRAVFLPWHQYMGYSFVRNQNPVVVSPAPTFFSRPVLVSMNPEVNGVTAPTDSDHATLGALVRAGPAGPWAATLRSLNVRFVLLAREADWNSYSYLGSQPGISRLGDFGSLIVYGVAPTI